MGLILNANNTVVLTNEAQPPQHLQLPSGEGIAILEHNSGQKCSGCKLTAQSSKGGGNWIVEALAHDRWMRSLRDFLFFTLYTN